MIKIFTEDKYNVLVQALINLAGAKDFCDNTAIYEYLEITPKTSLVCEIVTELENLGYTITKK